MKKKYILCDTPKGQYLIELEKVAEHRADYYASAQTPEDRNTDDYRSEVKWVMADSFEGIDWLLNNTDWSDWESTAIKYSDKVKVLEDDFWTSSENFEIIQVDEKELQTI